MLVTRAGDLALEIAAGLSVCLSVWAVRDVSTPIVGSGVEARLVEYGLGRGGTGLLLFREDSR